jgi:hypothetical protein
MEGSFTISLPFSRVTRLVLFITARFGGEGPALRVNPKRPILPPFYSGGESVGNRTTIDLAQSRSTWLPWIRCHALGMNTTGVRAVRKTGRRSFRSRLCPCFMAGNWGRGVLVHRAPNDFGPQEKPGNGKALGCSGRLRPLRTERSLISDLARLEAVAASPSPLQPTQSPRSGSAFHFCGATTRRMRFSGRIATMEDDFPNEPAPET